MMRTVYVVNEQAAPGEPVLRHRLPQAEKNAALWRSPSPDDFINPLPMPPPSFITLQLIRGAAKETIEVQRDEAGKAISVYIRRERRGEERPVITADGTNTIRVELCDRDRERELLADYHMQSIAMAWPCSPEPYGQIGWADEAQPLKMPSREDELRSSLGLARQTGKRAQRLALRPWAWSRKVPR